MMMRDGRQAIVVMMARVRGDRCGRILQQRGWKAIRANLEAERPVGCRHEPGRNQRTNDQRNQQRADHPQALMGGWNPAHCRNETCREGLAVYRFGSRTSTVTCDSVGTSLSFSLK